MELVCLFYVEHVFYVNRKTRYDHRSFFLEIGSQFLRVVNSGRSSNCNWARCSTRKVDTCACQVFFSGIMAQNGISALMCFCREKEPLGVHLLCLLTLVQHCSPGSLGGYLPAISWWLVLLIGFDSHALIWIFFCNGSCGIVFRGKSAVPLCASPLSLCHPALKRRSCIRTKTFF